LPLVQQEFHLRQDFPIRGLQGFKDPIRTYIGTDAATGAPVRVYLEGICPFDGTGWAIIRAEGAF